MAERDAGGLRVFVSYRRDDSIGIAGRIRDRLVARCGQSNVFFDIYSIPPGADFRRQIDAMVAECDVLLVIIGRRWVDAVDEAGERRLDQATDFVRLEVEAALRREIPVVPVLVDGATIPKANQLPASLTDLAYRNGIEVRYDPDFHADVDRLLHGLDTASPSPADAPPAPTTISAGSPPVVDPPNAPSVPTVVVDAMGRGDFDRVVTAVRSVEPGTRVLVRPGTYKGKVIVTKQLELVGDGAREDVVLEASGSDVVVWRARAGRIENLTIHQLGDGICDGVDVAGGAVDIEGCDISARGRAGVAVHASRGNVQRCRIHDCNGSGVVVYENGRGTFEDNDITANGDSGIAVDSGGEPVVRANRITGNTQSGVYVYENGRGTFEDNDITANGFAGIAVGSGGEPVVRGNRITSNTQSGVHVHEKGRGTFEDNDITANGLNGIEVRTRGEPVVRGNRITSNTENGVYIYENGRGTFQNNDITANGKAGDLPGIQVESGEPVFRGNRLADNGTATIWVTGYAGTYENNIGARIHRR
jgi:parallel beta-helix repeat protein